jgi:hypothetical protein
MSSLNYKVEQKVRDREGLRHVTFSSYGKGLSFLGILEGEWGNYEVTVVLNRNVGLPFFMVIGKVSQIKA